MKRTITLVSLGLVIFLVSGCGTVSTSGEYTLRSGNTVRGNLYITSGRATLEEGSRVTGSVFMTSGNLDVHGEIDGDIVVTSGRVNLGPKAVVHGDIRGTSGSVNQAEGSLVEGQISLNQTSFTLGSGLVLGPLFGCCCLPLLLVGLLIVLLAFVFRRRGAGSPPAAHASLDESPTTAPGSAGEAKQKLTDLKEMLDEGLITEAEYEAKKAEILAGM